MWQSLLCVLYQLLSLFLLLLLKWCLTAHAESPFSEQFHCLFLWLFLLSEGSTMWHFLAILIPMNKSLDYWLVLYVGFVWAWVGLDLEFQRGTNSSCFLLVVAWNYFCFYSVFKQRESCFHNFLWISCLKFVANFREEGIACWKVAWVTCCLL